MARRKLTLGVVSNVAAHVQPLGQMVLRSRANLGPCVHCDELLQQSNLDSPDAWIIDSDGTMSPEVDHWLQQLTVPTLYSEGDMPEAQAEAARAWEKRLSGKIQRLAGAISRQQRSPSELTHVWVLAASTGGPSAVKQFLGALPANLPVAFIYVQHIEQDFHGTLSQVMAKDSHYPVYIAEHGDIIESQAVALLTPDEWIDVSEDGTFYSHSQPWPGCYSPSVDQVVAKVARTYGARSGVIVFTGMGDDGARSSRLVKQQGGQVWVQSESSCTIASMPHEVKATGCAQFEGDPVTLAKALAGYVANRQSMSAQPSY